MKVLINPIRQDVHVEGGASQSVTRYQITSEDPTKFLLPGQSSVVEAEVADMEEALAWVRLTYLPPATHDRPDLGRMESEVNVVTGEITLFVNRQTLIIDSAGKIRLGLASDCESQTDWSRMQEIVCR